MLARFERRRTSITVTGGKVLAGTFPDLAYVRSVAILGDVTSIGDSAFSARKKPTSVEIGSAVTFIGTQAFINTGLTSVFYHGTAAEWAQVDIDGDNAHLSAATAYFHSEEEPAEAGNHWHYVNGVPKAW